MNETFKVKAYKKGNGVAIHLTGRVAESVGISGPCEIVLTKTANGVVMKPMQGSVIATVIGIDCFSWEDVEYVGRMMREKGFVPGVNEPKAVEGEAAE